MSRGSCPPCPLLVDLAARHVVRLTFRARRPVVENIALDFSPVTCQAGPSVCRGVRMGLSGEKTTQRHATKPRSGSILVLDFFKLELWCALRLCDTSPSVTISDGQARWGAQLPRWPRRVERSAFEASTGAIRKFDKNGAALGSFGITAGLHMLGKSSQSLEYTTGMRSPLCQRFGS